MLGTLQPPVKRDSSEILYLKHRNILYLQQESFGLDSNTYYTLDAQDQVKDKSNVSAWQSLDSGADLLKVFPSCDDEEDCMEG